jgi:hypothetical protein
VYKTYLVSAQMRVKDAIYNVHNPAKVTADQLHLTEKQRSDLAAVFFFDQI